MRIVFFTTDLVFPSRVAGIANRLGVPMDFALSAEVVLAKASADSQPPVLVLLDLNCTAVDARQIVPQLKALPHPPTVVAFGPHVHEAKLAAAGDAGCELVLTRGQFDSQMESVLKRFLA